MYKNKKRRKLAKECWGLNDSFFIWLKERLPIFLEDADTTINLYYYKFTIDNKVYTQKEIIEMMIEDLNYITNPKVDDWSEKYYNTVNHLMDCWSKVILTMWW